MDERVARAMCLDRDPDDKSGGPHPLGLWLDEGEAWWTGYKDAARLAIKAMREPTESMLDRGYGCLGDPRGDELAQAYRAMIDAASPDPNTA